MKFRNKRRRPTGAIIVLTAILMVVLFAMVAFSVDIGYMMLVRTQLQTSADSAALAAAGELLDSHFIEPEPTVAITQAKAKASARLFAGNNRVGNISCALADADITFGRLDLTAGRAAVLTFVDPATFNAAQVRVRRTAEQNGEVSLFFARALGIHSGSSQAVATAAFSDNMQGFKPPSDGKNLPILPLALDKPTWDALQDRQTGDHWTWNDDTKKASSGSDGVFEASLYPLGTGSSGNRGTVDVGSPNNNTADLSRQIRDGISPHDLTYLPGGKLQLSEGGTLHLNGDTGMSAGIKDDLAAIIGQPRIIPIYTTVSGNGNRAQYTIVGFAGVRIMAVNMKGNPSDRYVTIQPANISIEGGIPGPDGEETSYYIYSKHVWLVR